MHLAHEHRCASSRTAPICAGPPPASRSYQCLVTATHTPYPLLAELVPAIRSGTSLRQMADWVAGGEEWIAINEKWYQFPTGPRVKHSIAAGRAPGRRHSAVL
jgi:hypothetical protein